MNECRLRMSFSSHSGIQPAQHTHAQYSVPEWHWPALHSSHAAASSDHIKTHAQMHTLVALETPSPLSSSSLPEWKVQWSTLDSCMWWRHCSLKQSGVRNPSTNAASRSTQSHICIHVCNTIYTVRETWRTCTLPPHSRLSQQITSKHFQCECIQVT